MYYLALAGAPEWLIILGVVVLIFGARKLPELARAAGSSITEFKKGLKGDDQLEEKSSRSESKDQE